MENYSDIAIYLLAIVMLFLGWLAARLAYVRRLNEIKNTISTNDYHNGFEDGWKAALQSPMDVKRAHQYYFQNRS